MKNLITICKLILVAALATSGYAQGLPINSVVAVDTVEAAPGDHFSVAVRLSNNSLELGAIDVPLNYNSADLTLDSVSFVGSMVIPGFSAFTGHIGIDNAVRIFYIPDVVTPIPTLSASAGLIARLYFTLAPTAQSGFIAIDSINQISPVPIRLTFSNANGDTTLIPMFDAGGVIVKVPTAVDDDQSSGLPTSFDLAQNYPNPFNPTTQIEFTLPKAGPVKIDVFNVLGRRELTLVEDSYPAGVHTVEFDASAYPSGIYFYRMTSEGGTHTRKMALIK